MATPAHCYYCFESLAAAYEKQDPISLSDVEELWERHEQFKKLAALQDNQESESDSRGGGNNDNDDDDDDPEAGTSTTNPPPWQTLKPRGVSRLQSQMSSDSSSSTTPSLKSTNSSHSMLSTSTAATTPIQSDATSRTSRTRKDRHHPLFVTWNTISRSGHKSLRGCIGTFEAQELSAGLKSYALTSAFDDTRFSPIPSSLLPSLSCSLTLLGTFEPCTSATDWTLGLHGIRISFVHRGRRHGATYLPDVPVEQGWSKEETLTSLMRKAGWDGAGATTESAARRFLRGSSGGGHGSGRDSSKDKPWEQVADFRAVKYQGLKASATYQEWQEWREWVLGLGDGSEKLLGADA